MTAQSVSVKLLNNGLLIEGDLTLSTILQARAELSNLVGRNSLQYIDLSGVRLCDSSAVAWVLELQRLGVKVVHGAPAGFLAIIRVCQLDALFPDLAQNHKA
jgi:ABC-type transporter Mla MlaB component